MSKLDCEDFLDKHEGSKYNARRLPRYDVTPSELFFEGYMAEDERYSVPNFSAVSPSGVNAAEDNLSDVRDDLRSRWELPIPQFAIHTDQVALDAKNFLSVAEPLSQQHHLEKVSQHSVQEEQPFFNEVAEFDQGSGFSHGYISTVRTFGYDDSATPMSARRIIHVIATGPRIFDVTLQRYEGRMPKPTSASLRGVDIPLGYDKLKDIQALFHLRFDNLPRDPEYYGFSCVIGAYAGDDERCYREMVAELCRCLYEALSCQ